MPKNRKNSSLHIQSLDNSYLALHIIVLARFVQENHHLQTVSKGSEAFLESTLGTNQQTYQ